MDRHVQECFLSRLSDTSSVFPFFWQHGEDHETLAKEMEAIRASGATEFCVESRTHEKFCEDEWWEDFRFMLDWARDHGMRVWLLDDKHFPTGYANGYIDRHPELTATMLYYDYRDYYGPVEGCAIAPMKMKEPEAKIVSVTAWNRDGADFYAMNGEPIDLTDKIGEDGLIRWDLPAGTWRICLCYSARNRRPSNNYIDMLSPASCDAMIHAVYQPHYEKFKDYFGNTFRGFFSDEPSFQSFFHHAKSYYETVGVEDMILPWRDDLPEKIAEKIGKTPAEVRAYLPALWHSCEHFAPAVRAGYMDRITELYSENFCSRLGDWCRERKVEYIGHIIEDENSHQRLGFGGGHYFRALRGQDMSGIDIVLNQIVPFELDTVHTAPVVGKRLHPHFFHYMLGKLGASLSHIEPRMNNRAMAEVFGAFGWSEGVGYMKYLADQFLACGINQFVPHAFSPKYPDLDCPPHFYAAGTNPQFEAFGKLTEYMQKISRLTADSVHKADVAVFYAAQGEWTGGKHTLCQEICCKLTRNQIDFDILPEYVLDSEVINGRLCVNRETYGALIIPYCQILPDEILKNLENLAAQGLPVIFTDALPETAASGIPAKDLLPHCEAVAEDELAETLRARGMFHLSPVLPCPNLRVYRVDRDENSVYLLFNEGRETVDTPVVFENGENSVFYDVWNNRFTLPARCDDGALRVQLFGGEAIVLLCGVNREAMPHDYRETPLRVLNPTWTVTCKDATGTEFRPIFTSETLKPLNTPDCEQDFCGTIRYEAHFDASGTETVIDLGRVGEIATVTLNGKVCGTCVAAPYRFRIEKAVRSGENELTIDVINSPVYRERASDRFITYLPMPASGLLGPTKIG